MGLFDMGGGFDMSGLADLLNPIGTANAASPFDPISVGNVGGLTPEMLQQRAMAGMGGASEVNPSPVPPGGVPMPRPNPLQPPPDVLANAVQLNRGLTPPMDVPPPPITPPAQAAVPTASLDELRLKNDVGAALNGQQAAGAPPGAPTDISAQKRMPTDQDKANTLASALRGVTAPKPPEAQRIQSPAAPRPTTQIKGGELQALLMALNAGAPLAGRLPVTLGGGR